MELLALFQEGLVGYDSQLRATVEAHTYSNFIAVFLAFLWV